MCVAIDNIGQLQRLRLHFKTIDGDDAVTSQQVF
jgi:hypothetical protein